LSKTKSYQSPYKSRKQKWLQKKEERIENFPQVQASKISTKDKECSKPKGESSKDDEKGKKLRQANLQKNSKGTKRRNNKEDEMLKA